MNNTGESVASETQREVFVEVVVPDPSVATTEAAIRRN
jgi:hypothetical protein